MAYILVAEDDEDSMLLLSQILISLGHQVKAVRNGAEALVSMNVRRPDIIFSDILMPEMDGYELCREVQASESLRSIPFVFYTATYETSDDEALALDLGGAEFIRKGRDAANLLGIIDETVTRMLTHWKPLAEKPRLSTDKLAMRHEQTVSRKLAKKNVELKIERNAHKRSLELLEAVFAATKSAMVVISGDGKVVVWNDAATNIFGYEKLEAVGKNVHDLVAPPFYTQKIQRGLRQFAASGEGPILGPTNELIARRKDGSVFPSSFDVGSFSHDNEWYAVAMVRDVSERKKLLAQKAEAEGRVKTALINTLKSIAQTLEDRDGLSSRHQSRVAILCLEIAKAMELPEEMVDGIRLGAAIHDIGTLFVPSDILSYPGKLAPEKFDVIKEHPRIGFDLVKDAPFPWPIAEMILQHHERLDGSGYPDGLKGNNIVLEARILAVADTVEAMCSDRCYRPAPGVDAAIKYITKYSGIKFDTNVVDACARVMNDKTFDFDASY